MASSSFQGANMLDYSRVLANGGIQPVLDPGGDVERLRGGAYRGRLTEEVGLPGYDGIRGMRIGSGR